MAKFDFLHPYSNNDCKNGIGVFSTILAQFNQQRTTQNHKEQQINNENVNHIL